MGDVSIGDIAPDFTLEGTEGPFTLSDHRGERVVLLFYPGDNTTVCTKQFCAYRDASDNMANLDAVFVGISTQDMSSHESFKAKHGLTTPLLADPDGAVAKAYGVFTKRFGGIAKRTVFVIDPEGQIAYKHSNPMSLTYDGVDELRAALDEIPAKASS